MASYVDGFVLPVPKKNVAKYRALAAKAGAVWLDHGATAYMECVADDVKPGKLTSFPQSVKLKKDEVVFFSWITYKSRKHRDAVLKKVMADPRISWMCTPEAMPFDSKRMIYGGFMPVVSMAKKKKAGGRKAAPKAPARKKPAAKKKSRAK